MHLKSILFVLVLLCCSASHAQVKKYHLQLGLDSNAELAGISLRQSAEESSYAISLDRYTTPSDFLNTAIDADTGVRFSRRFNAVNVIKLWPWHGSWGYADFGIGLGVGDGQWGDNCRTTGIFASSCDIEEGTRLGIPLQASLIGGKMAGFGLSVRLFVTRDITHRSVGFTFAFGDFSR